jgi:hypothetical protein
MVPVAKIKFFNQRGSVSSQLAPKTKLSSLPIEVVGGTFLGTLRADDDTPELVGEFAEIHQHYQELRAQFASGELTQQAFGRAMSELRCVDRDGNEWSIGATSGQWYRRVGREAKWVATPIDYAIPASPSRFGALDSGEIS